MNNRTQQMILDYIRSQGRIKSRELIRLMPGWDFRKAITRLRRKGYPIENLNPPGMEAEYHWVEVAR